MQLTSLSCLAHDVTSSAMLDAVSTSCVPDPMKWHYWSYILKLHIVAQWNQFVTWIVPCHGVPFETWTFITYSCIQVLKSDIIARNLGHCTAVFLGSGFDGKNSKLSQYHVLERCFRFHKAFWVEIKKVAQQESLREFIT